MGTIGIFLGFAVLLVAVWRKYNLILAALVASAVIGLTNSFTLIETWNTYLVQGTEIQPFYDAMVGKLIVRAGTREEALRKMRAALCELVVDGVSTNIGEQLSIIGDERFQSGKYDLAFMGNR